MELSSIINLQKDIDRQHISVDEKAQKALTVKIDFVLNLQL